jgi:hypothetical protein
MAKRISKPQTTSEDLELQKRNRLDAAFAHMADDSEYQLESLLIAAEFSRSDWEALEAGEREITFPPSK